MIMSCRCTSPYQDQVHGVGRRVHNPSGKKDVNLAKCTVCGDKKPTPSPSKIKKEKQEAAKP